jgi:hypothetical protein
MAHLRKLLYVVALLALTGCVAPRRAQAQFIGYVSSQTVAQQVFTAQAANGSSGTVTNLGQSAHFLTYCNTGFGGTISLQASPDGTFATPLTVAFATYGQAGTNDTACHVLQAGGYYQTMRATVSNFSAGSVNAWYTATGSPIAYAPSAFTSNGPGAPIACDKFAVVTQAQSVANGVLVSFLGGTTKAYLCQLTISFNGATTAGVINIGDGNAGACSTFGGATDWQLVVTANTPQTVTFGGPLGSFTGSLIAGRCLMVSTGAITAAATFSFSYAQF